MPSSLFPIKINLNEKNNLNRNQTHISLGIPFPCGELIDTQHLSLLNENGQKIPFQSQIIALWQDSSIRWVLFDFYCSIDANKEIQYSIIKESDTVSKSEHEPIRILKNKNELVIHTGLARFHIDKNHFKPFNSIFLNEQQSDISSKDIELLDNNHDKFHAVIDDINYPNEKNQIKATIGFKGHFEDQDKNSFLSFQSSLSFFSNSALCELEFTVHNPKAASHPGGFWDMGNDGSEFFKALKLSFTFSKSKQIQWKENLNEHLKDINSTDIRLYQDSSGGKLWNHHLHIDKENNSTVSFKGYQLTIDDKISQQGDRAEPIFSINTDNAQIKSSIKQFWQNFPKAITVKNNQHDLELFPVTLKSSYEIQGGEQKTHSIVLDFEPNSCKIEQHLSPINSILPLQHYAKSNAIPWLPSNYNANELDHLIQHSVKGNNNFYIKRENSDEYGWRNFGELWADHETLEHGNDQSLVSHYNNQYDPIYGFSRQFLLTGNHQWFELMHDLARHVIDIDIYHTSNDRPEYNHGLFWHTDHYLDGRHCSHRTFSKTHMEIDHVEQSGGGPGIEHCYTSGLLSYYYLTGSLPAKNAVLELSNWIETLFDGSPTVLARLVKFIKRDIKNIKLISSGKKINFHQHPFTRGTGNYINTLLDAFQLTQDERYIIKAANIIKNSISPNDDISLRRLDTPEDTWSYLILLQSISKFIHAKMVEKIFDEEFYYAYDSFLHYVNWIVEFEAPYLERPERLVYPNDTWTAQDIRKAQILYFAYNLEKNDKYISKARELISFINENLNTEETYKSTRILCILAQNQFDIEHDFNITIPKVSKNYVWRDPSKVGIFDILFSFTKETLKRIFIISITEEINWIKQRTKN